MDTIGAKIKHIRVKSGLTQKEFGEKINASPSHISGVESDSVPISERLIKLICMEFGINEEWLKEGKSPMYAEELEEYTEYALINSTENFNKLLKTDSVLMRAEAAQLGSIFSELTDIEDFDDETKLLYLKMCKKLLNDITRPLVFLRKNAFSKQILPLDRETLTTIVDDSFKTIMDDLNSFNEFYIKIKQELENCQEN